MIDKSASKVPPDEPRGTETAPPADEHLAPLPGDELIPDARAQVTHSITIAAPPEAIWPRLVEMARPDGRGGYVALRSEAPHALVVGSLYDHGTARYLPFDAPRPEEFWHATWALVLDPIDAEHTRLHVRARVASTFEAVKWAAVWMHPFNDFASEEQLLELKHRVERQPPQAHGVVRDRVAALVHRLRGHGR